MSQHHCDPSPRVVQHHRQQYPPRYRQRQPQYHEHEDEHGDSMESSTSASEPKSNNQEEQTPLHIFNTHPLESILRMANNEIGVDSRDNVLSARRGERPTTLARIIEKAARNMGGDTHNVLMIAEADLLTVINDMKKVAGDLEKMTEERDRALHELGELQAKFNEASSEEA